jgi:DNA polymerase-3 subunit beta
VKDVSSLITDTQGLLQFVRLAEGQEKAEVFLGDNQLSFRLGDTDLHTRLLDGPFPDYTAVIPKSNDRHMTVDREAFMAAVRRVSITADRVTSQIRLGVENGRLELSATGTDGSRAEDELPVSFDGEPMEIGFNYNYLLDALKNIGTDSVQVAMKDAQSAAIVTPVDDDEGAGDLLCLLMPLRLTD